MNKMMIVLLSLIMTTSVFAHEDPKTKLVKSLIRRNCKACTCTLVHLSLVFLSLRFFPSHRLALAAFSLAPSCLGHNLPRQ